MRLSVMPSLEIFGVGVFARVLERQHGDRFAAEPRARKRPDHAAAAIAAITTAMAAIQVGRAPATITGSPNDRGRAPEIPRSMSRLTRSVRPQVGGALIPQPRSFSSALLMISSKRGWISGLTRPNATGVRSGWLPGRSRVSQTRQRWPFRQRRTERERSVWLSVARRTCSGDM